MDRVHTEEAHALSRFRAALREHDLTQAVLSHPETLANIVGYEHPFEEWPVANPLVAAPPLLLVRPQDAVLLLPEFYGTAVEFPGARVVTSRTFVFVGAIPDAESEFEQALGQIGIDPVLTGVEAAHLPLRVADLLRRSGADLRPIDGLATEVRARKHTTELESIRRACAVADAAQQAIKDVAEPGRTELEIAGHAQTAMFLAAGRRLPAILTVTTGAEGATGGVAASGRAVQPGDFVLADVAPWVDGAWADTANAVVAGTPSAEQQRMFDAVRGALDLALSLCRPGAIAGSIHRQVHESLSAWGDEAYFHHTGHGLGASWAEKPFLVPDSADVLEEGMVVAVEPGLYRPGLGGIRLEHVALIHADGAEVLTRFEHTL